MILNEGIRQALSAAIEKERSAYRLYLYLAEMSKNKNTRILFKSLATEELKHEDMIKECIRCHMSPDDVKKKDYVKYLPDMKICDQIDRFEDIAGMEDGFRIAIKREITSKEMYKNLLKKTGDTDLRRMIKQLIQEEESHESRLREEFMHIYGQNEVIPDD